MYSESESFIKQMSFAQLLNGNRVLKIPPYQRVLSWPQEEWNNLFQDIYNTATKKNAKWHLFQMIQLRSLGNGEYEVGDGQQRITHVSIFLTAMYRFAAQMTQSESYKSASNFSEIEGFIDRCGFGSTATGYLVAGTEEEDGRKVRQLRLKTSLLYGESFENMVYGHATDADDKLFEFIQAYYRLKIEEFLSEEEDSENYAGKISRFISLEDSLVNKFKFAVAEFNEKEKMQDSYEATNSRGVELSDAELIKNYIFKFFPIKKYREDGDLYSQTEIFSNDSFGWLEYEQNKDYGSRVVLFEDKKNGKKSVKGQYTERLDELIKADLSIRLQGKLPTRLNRNGLFRKFKDYWDDILLPLGNQERQKVLVQFLRELRNEYSILEMIAGKDSFSISSRNDNMAFFKKRALSFVSDSVIAAPWKDSEDYKKSLIEIVFLLVHKFSEIEESKQNGAGNVFKERNIDGIFRTMENLLGRNHLYNFGRDTLTTNGGGNCYDTFHLIFDTIEYAKPGDLLWENFRNNLMLFNLKNYTNESKSFINQEKFEEAIGVIRKTNNGRNTIWVNLLREIHRYEGLTVDREHSTLEHFMPQSDNKGTVDAKWVIPDGRRREEYVHNLGNYFLLTKALNGDIGNDGYNDKYAQIVARPDAHLKPILDSSKWTYEEIEALKAKRLDIIKKMYSVPVPDLGEKPAVGISGIANSFFNLYKSRDKDYTFSYLTHTPPFDVHKDASEKAAQVVRESIQQYGEN